MNNIAIYTLTSPLHDAESVYASTQSFLEELKLTYDFCDNDYTDYGTHVLDLIYVRTGGTENLFLQLLPDMRRQSKRPFYLLASGQDNSLAASLEILSFLQQQGLKGEVIHGEGSYVANRIDLLLQTGKARLLLSKSRLGIIGKPSDWLISSTYDAAAVSRRLGIELIDIDMAEVVKELKNAPHGESLPVNVSESLRGFVPGAVAIYETLKRVVTKNRLDGFTIRCFDLLSSFRNTGCWALARLNADGIVAGCEGDVPAMLTMKIGQVLTGCSGFQSNPASINPETGEMVLAHCTIPFNMVERYELDTHFESGIGIGIRGFVKPGPVTVFKVSGDLSRHFVAEGELLRSEAKNSLCRTQLVVRFDNPQDASYFLTQPIGNHHVVLPGHWRKQIEEII